MEKSKTVAVMKRIVTSLILAPVVLSGVLLGSPFINILVLVCGAMLSWEWAKMVPNKNNAVFSLIYLTSLAVAVLVNDTFSILWIMCGGTALAWYKARNEEHRKLLVLGVPYITLGLGSVIWLFNCVGVPTTLWFVLAIWSVDIGGYLVGCSVKGPKLAPKISPNKTWSGLGGGIVFSVLVSVAYAYVIGNASACLAFGLLGALVAVIEQTGDLIESALKRYLGLKDSSNLIPGHGGIFDRIDGMIFTAPFVALLFQFGLNFMM